MKTLKESHPSQTCLKTSSGAKIEKKKMRFIFRILSEAHSSGNMHESRMMK
ncbi:hypothetical protein DPMN_028553 [Dreissena polymorpha]|uniref:Uncharacterized protein n=1 Tax=Dreissena polymorpha TaxID=45954 RepID=A0A9D4REN7_DREPO|nr:hypothetical protein DPMN_028553 [Dreissena polymorpha]